MNRTLMIALALGALSFEAVAQGNGKGLGLGLRPDTPDQLREMHKKGMRKIKKVNLSPLGFARANAERKKRGLAELPVSEARGFGHDTDVESAAPVTDAMGVDSGSQVMGGTGVIPTAVDNSLLPSFPSIRSQGSIGSCVTWAAGYYQNSHHHGLALGYNNKGSDLSKICSPKFLYPQINFGSDGGSYFSDAYSLLQSNGCVSWSQLPYDNNYRAWDLDGSHWKDALKVRALPPQYVYNLNTATGLQQAKELLNNGYVLVFGTYINSFQYKAMGTNPNLASNPLAGLNAIVHLNGSAGGHAMTIVGYDDEAWVDINGNGAVDAGESGVFKIANSWGTGYGYAGFYYMSYDAIKVPSGVAGAPVIAGRTSALQSNMVYHQPIRVSNGVQYAPKYLANLTLKHASRSQLTVRFGHSITSATAPSSNFYPASLSSDGGAFGLDGNQVVDGSGNQLMSADGVTPVANAQGSFSFDISDLPISAAIANRIYLTIQDSGAGANTAAELSRFEIVDVLNSRVLTYAPSSPLIVDNSSKTIYLDLVDPNINQLPIADFSNSALVGPAPLTVNFDAGSSSDPDGSIASYSWNFGDGSSATGMTASHSYSSRGLYTVTLTVKDNRGDSATKSVQVDTRDKIAPVVSLTSPVSGQKISGSVAMAANASDNFGVAKVEFYLAGKLVCTDTSAPYSCSASLPKGNKSNTVQAKAYDSDGNVGSSAVVSFSSGK